MQILSFDIGGSKIAWALINELGQLQTSVETVPTPQNAAAISELLQEVIAAHSFSGFAIATAGVVYDNHLQGKPNNLPVGYEKIDFAALAKMPVTIVNDANAALWAEYKIGALRGVQHGILLTLGTDVGCGIICNGQMLQGKCGAAGEVNFTFSGRGLQKTAAEHELQETDCFVIHKMARHGHPTARAAYLKWEESLITGLAELNRLLDTEIIALSGSVAKIVDYAKINTSLKLLQPHNSPKIVSAVCANNAGIIGAALLCANKFN